MARHEKIRGRVCKRLKIVSKLSDAAVTAPFADQLSQNAQTLQPQKPHLCLFPDFSNVIACFNSIVPIFINIARYALTISYR